MANLKASKQDIKRNKRNYDRNKHLKTLLKSALKRAYQSIENDDSDTIYRFQLVNWLINRFQRDFEKEYRCSKKVSAC